jgi:hypothetical protein
MPETPEQFKDRLTSAFAKRFQADMEAERDLQMASEEEVQKVREKYESEQFRKPREEK